MLTVPYRHCTFDYLFACALITLGTKKLLNLSFQGRRQIVQLHTITSARTMRALLLAALALPVAALASLSQSTSELTCDGQCNHQCDAVSITVATCEDNCVCSTNASKGPICSGTNSCDTEEATLVCKINITSSRCSVSVS